MASSLEISSTLTIAPGVTIPRLGLGVFRAGAGDGTREAVKIALQNGYRHIDTASIYRNEVEVGEGLRASGIRRESVFLTTKLWNDHHGTDAALYAFEDSLKALGVAVVDLYLIHRPVSELRRQSWRTLERIHAEGRARAIGVSNYTARHLNELLQECTVRPAVNQIEVHPFLQQRAVREFCTQEGIAVEAYSPLTKGRRLQEPTLVEVSAQVQRTPTQVLLRWGLQQGLIILPRSSNPGRIQENAALFDFSLSESQMRTLDALEDGGRTAWDPTPIP